ncbi:LamG domain-containing protein [Undibacterium sp. Xuan67W]|uniref:LamG domain-containing protein n=1 Tax=Undibacterium sp. Xuan67W TaxID=3413057 RepID=UPI003BEFDD94
MSDTFYYQCKALLNFEGANGDTTFINYALGPTLVIQSGTPSISTSQKKFGASSVYFNGSSNLIFASPISLGTGDYTYEGRLYLTTMPSGYGSIITDGGSSGIFITGAKAVFYDSGDRCASSTITTGVWYHLAVTREAGLTRLFLDGVASASTHYDPYSKAISTLGGHGSEFMTGYIDDVRITQGVARYTANFTPPGAIDISAPQVYPKRLPLDFHKTSLVASFATPKALVPVDRHKDIYFGGAGEISGTVKESGTPDFAVVRRVRLHVKKDGVLARETWSHVDGSYSFKNIAIQPYYVVSNDHTGNLNAVIKDSIVPEVQL